MITLLAPLARIGSGDIPAAGPSRPGLRRRWRCRWCRPLFEFALTLGAVTLVLALAVAMKIVVYGWGHDHHLLMVELARLLRP